MTAPTKLPKVTRIAINLQTDERGYKNRIEIPQHVIDSGFPNGEIPRQWVNDIFYNHGENLDYCMYYNNRPFTVQSKENLPDANENVGVIYYVANTNKLVISVGGKWCLLAQVGGEI